MEIRPAKDYKKPLYAIGLVTAIMSVPLTGCADLLSPVMPGVRPTNTETVQLAGETSVMYNLEQPKNTEYDVSPYRIKDIGYLSSARTVTDKNQLDEFAKGNCLDNSPMENFFGKMKNEMFYGHEYEFETLEQLQELLQLRLRRLYLC